MNSMNGGQDLVVGVTGNIEENPMKFLERRMDFNHLHERLETFYINQDGIISAQALLADDSVDLIITDPPYGIDGHTLHKHYNRDEKFVIEGYVEIPISEYQQFSISWLQEADRVLRPGGSAYIVSGWTNLHHIQNALLETDLQLINHIIWKYNFGVFTRKKFTTSHYHILYLVKPGEKPTFNTFSRYSPSEKTADGRSRIYEDMEDVWIIPRVYKNGQIRHKNELPPDLLVKMMQYSSNEGDVVLDFFAGSFSTAKVAKGLNRSSISFELNAKACEHQVPLVDRVEWGELLTTVPQGKDDRPGNQYKKWTDTEIERLRVKYLDYRSNGYTKKKAISVLCEEFDRGYFSVLNIINHNRFDD